jgi:hypothetical protein
MKPEVFDCQYSVLLCGTGLVRGLRSVTKIDLPRDGGF